MIYGFASKAGPSAHHSEVGWGTTVKLIFPGHARTPSSSSSATDAAGPGNDHSSWGRTTVRLIISAVLEELGYAVLLATDARPAIPLLQSDRRIDLMISDVVLPHIDGRKLAEIARAARPDLKVLFVSGYAEQAAFRGDFLDTGMDMLTKPFALDALGAKVRARIER